MQYLICTVVLIVLAFFTIESSLLPWMKERDIGSWESYRYLAARNRIEGNFAEAKRCLDAALQEAHWLKDDKKVELIKADLVKLSLAEKLAIAQSKNAVIPDIDLVWPSPLDIVKSRKKGGNFERWEPFLRIILQQQTVAAANNPARLIGLGDALFDMSQFKPALNNYLKVVELNNELKDNQTQVCALERSARVYSSLGSYAESQSFLNRALQLNPSNASSLQLHLAQSYLDSGDAQKASMLCDDALKTGSGRLSPQIVWYEKMLKGITESRLHHSQTAVEILQDADRTAEKLFGPSSLERYRNLDELFQAQFEAGEFDAAKETYRKVTTLREANNPNRAIHTVTLTSFREGQQYMDANQLKLAIWLWEWSLEDRIKEMGPTHRGVARRLYCLVRAYKKAGDRTKMLDAWKRARAILPVDPDTEPEK